MIMIENIKNEHKNIITINQSEINENSSKKNVFKRNIEKNTKKENETSLKKNNK